MDTFHFLCSKLFNFSLDLNIFLIWNVEISHVEKSLMFTLVIVCNLLLYNCEFNSMIILII